MKSLIENYSFNKTNKTITFTDFTSISLKRVLVITNVTSNLIIYNFADASAGGSSSTNVLTLDYDTTSMANTDELQIWYDDPSADLAPSLINKLGFLSTMQGIAGDMRVTLLSGTLTTLTTVTTVTTLTGQTNIGGYGAQHTIMNQMNTNANQLRQQIITG